jgi:predicted GNAT family N-acyltransferase
MDSSLSGAVAYVDDQPVSMARLVGDGHINIYLQDVITRKAYRGQGHAGHVIRALLTHAQHQYAPDLTIGLFAADGQDGVYAPFGFRTRPCNGYGPGMFARLGDLAIADNRQ